MILTTKKFRGLYHQVHGGPNSDPQLFYDTCSDQFLHQHVNGPTRAPGQDTPSLLDLILSRSEFDIDKLEFYSPIGASDHAVLIFDFLIDGKVTREQSFFFKHNFDKSDFVSMNFLFICYVYDIFLSKYNLAISRFTPQKKISQTSKPFKKKWMTRSFLSLRFQLKTLRGNAT